MYAQYRAVSTSSRIDAGGRDGSPSFSAVVHVLHDASATGTIPACRSMPDSSDQNMSLVVDCDSWDGYPARNLELLDWLRQESIRNVVAITGDLQASQCGFTNGLRSRRADARWRPCRRVRTHVWSHRYQHAATHPVE
ncbi:alkaline phosphatase D family protein [Paraburkholderia sp. PGU19]|uniref:alkaline phosphatase D family protein n=1 Tax=Paraburkholderia sp. PGU19 TaxID=2735434 RepID=UPI0031F839EC